MHDSSLRRVCVYCGSRPGLRPAYADAARDLGQRLAEAGLGVVTGGGRVGLMGVVAGAVLDAGGEAVGVIPQALMDREVGFARLTELHVVETMHHRKAMMADLADAFVALPGGLGTLEEIAEVKAVRGHGDPPEPGHRLADRTRILEVEGVRIAMVHDLEWPPPIATRDRATRDGRLLFPPLPLEDWNQPRRCC